MNATTNLDGTAFDAISAEYVPIAAVSGAPQARVLCMFEFIGYECILLTIHTWHNEAEIAAKTVETSCDNILDLCMLPCKEISWICLYRV